MYERACTFWHLLYKVVEPVVSGRSRAQFWGAHQRFFKQMLMAVSGREGGEGRGEGPLWDEQHAARSGQRLRPRLLLSHCGRCHGAQRGSGCLPPSPL